MPISCLCSVLRLAVYDRSLLLCQFATLCAHSRIGASHADGRSEEATGGQSAAGWPVKHVRHLSAADRRRRRRHAAAKQSPALVRSALRPNLLRISSWGTQSRHEDMGVYSGAAVQRRFLMCCIVLILQNLRVDMEHCLQR